MTHSGKLHGDYDWFQTLDQKKTQLTEELYFKYSRNMRKHVSQNYWINVISSTLSAAPLFARTVNLVCAALCFTIYWSNLIRGICNWIDVNPYSFFLSGYFTNTRMYFFFFFFFQLVINKELGWGNKNTGVNDGFMLSHASKKDREEGPITSHHSQLQPHPPSEHKPCCWARTGEVRRVVSPSVILLLLLVSTLQNVLFQLYLIAHPACLSSSHFPPLFACCKSPRFGHDRDLWGGSQSQDSACRV